MQPVNTAASGVDSLFKRQGPAPEGVEEQLAFAEGASGASCLPRSEPTITADPIYIADARDICFVGFAPGADIEGEVHLPDGSVRRNRLRANDLGVAGWEWYGLPGDSIGTYTVFGSQGSQTATSTFTVEAPPKPWISVRPAYGPPGTTFEILLAGFDPDQTGFLPLYRQEQRYTYDYTNDLIVDEYLGLHYGRYITALPFTIDARGESRYALRTSPDDPPGSYLVYAGDQAINGPFYIQREVPPPPGAAPGSGESVLQRRDPLPDGVEPFVHPTQSDVVCYPTSTPHVNLLELRRFADDEMTLPYQRDLCLRGFASNQEVVIQVRRSDGFVVRESVTTNDDGVGVLPWTAVPGDPLGEYTVSATQGPRTATGTFAVNRATTPLITTFSEPGPPGTSFEIMLAGFQPNREVQLRLYASQGCAPQRQGDFSDPAIYVSSLPPVRVDERGEAVLTVRTHVDDSPGTYFITDDESSVVNLQRRAARFIVVQPEDPAIEVTLRQAPAGSAFRISMRDFHPRGCVTPLLFRRTTDGGYSYVASLTYAIMDDQGAGQSTFSTLPDSEPGEYLLVTGKAYAAFTLQATAAQAAPTPQAEGSSGCGMATVIGVAELAIRAEPSRSAALLAGVPEGDVVELVCAPPVDADQRTWRRVRYGTIEGWMSTRFLLIDE